MNSTTPAVTRASGRRPRITTAVARVAEHANDPTPPERAHPHAATWLAVPPTTQPDARP
jgi:hypothetical protein